MRVRKLMPGSLLALVLAAGPALADEVAKPAARSSGTVIAVDEEAEVFEIQGADGRGYEVEAAAVAAEEFESGGLAEYDIVEAKSVSVEKAAR